MTGSELTLAVDFGTTHTVAVASRGGAAPRVVSVDGAPYLPSAVLLGADGGLVVGGDALRLGRSAGHRLELRPKSRLDEDMLLLGNTPVDVLDIVRAVLGRVCAEAARQAGRPVGHLALTHPADWGAVRLGRLSRAAAGLAPRISLVAEPVAAAARGGLPVGAVELVLDLGGGTCDAAVVRRDGAGFAVLACAGLPDLGGDDLDQRIVDHIRATRPELADRIAAPSTMDVGAIREARLFRQDARAAKELLSRHESAKLTVPGLAQPVELTRNEFEALVEPDLRRIVELARRVLGEAGVDRSTPRGVHLVGGTSRIPRLAMLLGEELRLPVHPDPEPEAGVAWGAIELTAAADAAAPTAPAGTPPAHPPAGIVHNGRSARGPLAAGVAVVVAATLAVVGTQLSGGQEVGGRPVAASAAPAPPSSSVPSGSDTTPTFPPLRPGKAVVGAGAPSPTVVPAGESGLFKATGTYEGATEIQEEVRLQQGEVADLQAPAGYRWVVAKVEVTLRVGDELPYGDGHNVHLLDDRGQLVDSANRAGEVTVDLCGSNQQNLPRTENGGSRTECAVFLVPVATAVRGVLFDDRAIDPTGEHALLFPISVPAAGPAVLPTAAGQIGGPPVEVRAGSGYAEIGVADVIDEPSAYLVDPKPPPGTRLFVVRYTVAASGAGTVRTFDVQDGMHVLDDRGMLVPFDVFVSYRQRNCPTPAEELGEGDSTQGCLVFGLAKDASISRVVYQPRLERDDPARWTSWQAP
ncbi:Hsp70 family protein [Actinophytocola sp.]|uniref:Hsp70 family protein n=1 Tax=Actinophytocola sp. TaxID=1872138 RepID=UPI003D6BFF8B